MPATVTFPSGTAVVTLNAKGSESLPTRYFLPQNGQHCSLGYFVKSVFIGEGQQVLSPVFKVKTGRRWKSAISKQNAFTVRKLGSIVAGNTLEDDREHFTIPALQIVKGTHYTGGASACGGTFVVKAQIVFLYNTNAVRVRERCFYNKSFRKFSSERS